MKFRALGTTPSKNWITHRSQPNYASASFFVAELKFLSHISVDGIKPNPANVLLVQIRPKPINETQVRSFRGLANYFRKCIPSYTPISAFLEDLPGKKGSIKTSQHVVPIFWSLLL